MNHHIPNFKLLYTPMESLLMQQPHKAMFEQYTKESNLKSMFQYLWEMNEAHTLLKVDINPPLKNEIYSENLRKQGNKLYQSKKFQQALEKYNMSIMVAPHPDITQGEYSADIHEVLEEDDVKSKYNELALGYANRSAVLYQLNQYQKSIADVDWALKFGYPKTKHYKLAERKAKCLIALNKHQEAKTLLKTTIASLASLADSDVRNSLEKLEADCLINDQQTSNDHTSKSLYLLSEDELSFAFNNPAPPILKDVNPKIPAFSSALGLTYSKYSGRGVIATRDIKPGELLAVEAPYSSMLLFKDPTNVRTHCWVCAARCLTPLPCTHCNKVIFCSESCRNEGISKFHRLECNVLPTLIDLDMGVNADLVYRLFAQTPFLQFKSIIKKIEDENEKPRQLQGFNEQGVYDSSNYKTIFHLEGNISEQPAEHQMRKCCIAFVLTKLLIKSTSYFVDELGKSLEPSLSDIILVGSTVFMHLINISLNSAGMNEYQVSLDKEAFGISHSALGVGVYSATSLFNHSCNASSYAVSYGFHHIMYSISFIPEGSEVFLNYRDQFYMEGVHLSRPDPDLLKVYKFQCKCEACANNWPTSSFLKKFPKLKQSEKMILRGATGSMAKLDPANRSKIECYLKILQLKLDSWFEELDDIDRNLAADSAIPIEVLEFVGRFADMPCSLYADAQDMFEQFVLVKQGSCNYSK